MSTGEQLVDYVKIDVGNEFVYGTVREPYTPHTETYNITHIIDYVDEGHVIITRAEDKPALTANVPDVIHMRNRPGVYNSLIKTKYLIPLSELEVLVNYDKLITLEEWTQ